MKIALALHHHQPIGNFDHVIEAACDEAYLPFLEVLRDFPDLRINVHYSGALLEWLAEHRPDVIESLKMTTTNLEWMGGGCYEPILASIPENDRLDQLRRLNDRLLTQFEVVPRGAWIAERVWEPSLAGTLNRAGYDYTVVDDSAFARTGLDLAHLNGPYAVDHNGRTLAIFPISESLRYAIPANTVEEVMAMLRRMHDDDPDRLVVFADDAEKFGHWESSNQRLYGDGWLASFFGALMEADWLEVTTFEAVLDAEGPLPHVALPPASYHEMEAWSGGYFPNFVDQYPTVGLLHHKMLRLSRQLRRASTESRTGLLRSQNNCAWWHGGFGGVYLPHLRNAVHEQMIDSRVIHDHDQHRGRGWTELETLDWDADRADELHVELPDQSWVLDPAEGGSLHYFDDKPGRWAVSDVMTRVPEPYHPDGTVTDAFPHRWLADRHLPEATTPDQVAALGNRPPTRSYEIVEATGARGSVRVKLRDSAGRITKTISATDRRIQLEYVFDGAEPGRFGPRLPISVWEGAAEMRIDGGSWTKLVEPERFLGHRFRFRHTGRDLEVVISSPIPAELFTNPIRTLSRNENDATEEILQGMELWPHFTSAGTGTYQLTVDIGEAQ